MISIISLLYYILIFYGVKYSCFGKFHDNFLSLKILNGLKGLASISILIGHMNLDHPEFRNIISYSSWFWKILSCFFYVLFWLWFNG